MSKYFDGKDISFLAPEVKENGRHMIMTNVQTECKTKYVNIDTRFQEEYNMQNFADITFKLPQQISNVKSITVTNIEIPSSFYPFSLRRKNTYFKITNVLNPAIPPTVIKIDERSYSNASLLYAIKLQLIKHNLDDAIIFKMHTDDYNNDNADGVGDTFKVEIYNSSDVDYAISFNVDELGNSDKYNLKSKLGWCLGFRETTYALNSHVELVSEGLINVNPFTYLFISVDDFLSNAPNSFIAPSIQSYMNSNILGRITLDHLSCAFGGSIVASHMTGRLLSDRRTYEGKHDIQKLRIQILDEFGVVVDLNKMDFAFTLEIVYM